jgi:hypothetical protein
MCLNSPNAAPAPQLTTTTGGKFHLRSPEMWSCALTSNCQCDGQLHTLLAKEGAASAFRLGTPLNLIVAARLATC